MIAEADAKHLQQVLGILRAAFPDAILSHASDARSALFKMQNVPHQVLVTTAGELEKNGTGLQLIDAVSQDPGIQVGIVVLATASIPENYTPEILSGRLHICARPVQQASFLRAMGHALHYRPNQFSGSFQIHSLQPGEILFLEGDRAELAFLVKSGKLRASRSRDGKVSVLGEILPGEFVGEMAYINGDPRSADVEALEGCELIQIPLSVFDSLLFTKPAWSMAMMKTLSKRLKTAND
ncbi:MAG: Crp/Fnr family transcriptional regulator [Bacteriovoracia bacterium]